MIISLDRTVIFSSEAHPTPGRLFGTARVERPVDRQTTKPVNVLEDAS